MTKNICLKIILLSFIIIVSNQVIAQKKSSKSTSPKFKPPVVKTYLGGIRGTTDSISIAKGQQIIDSSLKIIDAKGNTYTITYYQFAFKRVGISEDSAGNAIPETDLAADHFTTTPLPNLWRNTIKETLVKDEEIHFFDIVVMDNKGQHFFAPELKIAFK